MTPPPPRRRSRRRPALAALAIVGGLALVGVSAFQVLRGLELRREAARRQLREHVGTATRAFSDAVIQAGSYVRPLIMAPVLGAVSREGDAPLRLADVARYAESELARLGFTGDSLRGYLRLPLVPAAGGGDSLYASTPGRTEVAGALASDSAFGAAALAAARELVDGVSPAATRFVARNFHVRGHPVVLTVAFELRPDLRPVAAFGCVYSRAHFLSLIAKDVFGNIALLPPSFEGFDWSSAAPLHAGGGGSRSPAREWTGSAARLNALLAVSVIDDSGALMFASPRARLPGAARADRPGAFSDTQHVGVRGSGYVVHAELDEADGERLVRAAVPLAAEGRLLAGQLALAALLAAAAVGELRRQRQLARAQAEFVSAVSHEMRTPLAHMAVMSETLLTGGADSPEQERRWLAVIHRESLRLGRLVENVLLHARAGRGRLPLEPAPVDLAELARELAAGAQPLAAARSVTLRLELPPRLAARADPGAVRQVLLNLLDNALKYGPEGQTVTLALRRDDNGAGPTAVFTVDDQGPGVPRDARDRIWAPFERLGDLGGATGGSGLGLSVVRDLAERHGGTAAVGDAPGGGARFVVRLPLEGRD